MHQLYSFVLHAVAFLTLSGCVTVQSEATASKNPVTSDGSQMSPVASISATATSARCAYNREDMLALDVVEFDQTAPGGG